MNMCGIKTGVSNKILSKKPKAFSTHIVLNLAAGDMMKSVRFLKGSMDITCKTSNLQKVKESPKRDAMLQKIRKNTSLKYLGFRVLCCFATRLNESLNGNLEPEIKGRIIGVKS